MKAPYTLYLRRKIKDFYLLLKFWKYYQDQDEVGKEKLKEDTRVK